MAAQYLLPCDCGATTPVETNQAGNTVICSCGKQLEVPSLRAIRELAPHGVDDAARGYEWNPAAGLIFVGGMFLAFIGAGVALFMHINSVQAVSFELPPEDEVAAWVAEIDSAPPEELFNMWNSSRHMGLGDHRASPFVQARMISARFATYRNTGLIIMASGLVFAGTSFFVRRKPS